MKKLLLAFLSMNIFIVSMAQQHVANTHSADTSKAIRFYMDSLQVTDAQARLLFRIEHEYRANLWAALRDSTATMADRQLKMKANQQKKKEALGKLLNSEQLERLKHLAGQKAQKSKMKSRWETQRKERDYRYSQKKQTIDR